MPSITRLVRYKINNHEGRAMLNEDGSLAPVDGCRAMQLADVELLPPVQPSKIIGIGLNYRAHAEEMKKKLPEEPLMFFKPSTAVVAPEQSIVMPRGYDRIDFEGELAVVFSKPARNVSAAQAFDVIAGFCCINDVTVRDLQVRDIQYTRAKGFDTFAPIGPYLVSGIDPMNLQITTRVNDQVRQSSSTSDMIFPVPQLVEAVTRVMTMLPGDIIATGTPPGVGPIQPGDVIEIEIEGIGILRNSVIIETL